jgi:tripartite-type tricarboxylate transporter receptor subunit TctC
MTMKKQLVSHTLVACLGSLGFVSGAIADAYPSNTITMIIPYPAGGSTDVLGRILAASMSTTLKQQVIVENIGGAGGTLGTGRAARAAADGYTILFHNMAHATAPSLYAKLPYDPQTSFEPIASVADVPMILVARKNFGPKSYAELVSYARANPGKITFANAGVGATSHLCSLLITSATKLDMTLISYKGTGPALNDLVGGHVDMICDQPASTTSWIKKGDIKAIAVATRERLPVLKEVPTFGESGLKNFELSVWHGMYAPKGTPAGTVAKIGTALQTALKDPSVIARFDALGAVPAAPNMQTPEGLRAHLKSEISRLGTAIRAAGVPVQ